MTTNRLIGFAGAAFLAALAATTGAAAPSTPALAPASLPAIATVDARYQSYNVEMAEVVGGNFWKPYTAASIAAMKAKATAGEAAAGVAGQDPTMFQARAPIDLASPRLRKLAAALGPAYMRTSGTWANTVYFHDADGPAPAKVPEGFQGVLSRAQWKGVIDFAQAVDARLVTSFAIGAGVRDQNGVWTSKQARKFVAYTKATGGDIAAAEFFNEPDMPVYGGAPKGYTAQDYARDFAVFRAFAHQAAPDMQIVGPGSVGEGVLMPTMGGGGLAAGLVRTADMLAATPKPTFDVFSYHFYGAASIRCASMGAGAQTAAADALSEAWLARTDTSYDFYVKGLRDRYAPGKPVWITETADAACGGNPWAATFLDSFRYLDQLGRLARRGVSVVFHNTLASSEYGLLEGNTFTPRPNYWAALLWHRLMGSTVLDAGPSHPGLHLYAQCLPGHPGGVTVLAINNSRAQPASIELPLPARRYTLGATKLEDSQVQLNGHTLALAADDALPSLQGASEAAGRAALAPATITFFAMADAANPACH
ncbi:hypothetical protein RHOFW104T7_02885 [Rhodanobacter thiooxydans]|uniref:Beta-glucuronidase n=1 Tax=Rhodanobacter thiooxydans TaxID=416169 RepID=A0A154QCW0_9GAMM|nr:hypothetical protein [Rhodanobacter thiooxydans]EIL97732.1 hypothetical protein UUA_14119 [Rhodanobacter thiooxydans LCS2]KZC21972.1 hypothetical protein RHOFW104T7_02885 [Rhodanobacter thiooxydans]MCW0202904.1 hypothetical protein [Rhodanobacter thiooxydans]